MRKTIVIFKYHEYRDFWNWLTIEKTSLNSAPLCLEKFKTMSTHKLHSFGVKRTSVSTFRQSLQRTLEVTELPRTGQEHPQSEIRSLLWYICKILFADFSKFASFQISLMFSFRLPTTNYRRIVWFGQESDGKTTSFLRNLREFAEISDEHWWKFSAAF